MKKILIIALVLVMAGCKTYQASSESNKTDIERSERNERDSIYIRDSVIVRITGDTVYKDRWRTEYKDRIVQHVDTIVRVDEKVVETVVEKKVIPRLAWYAIAYAAIMTTLIILWIILKIKRII